jgi:hypothetical protein
MAVVLNMQITRGSLKTCKPCAVSKARQMNVNSKSEGTKAEKFNGHVYHDIAIVKESNDDKKLGHKSVWHFIAEERVNFKTSNFFVSKSEMPTYMWEYMESEKVQGHLIAIIRQDNAGGNKKLMTMAHLKDWKHETIFKNKARKTPQQNLYAELAFTVLAAKARAMLSAAQVSKDEHHKLWGETVMTATVLDNLIPVTWNEETKTRYEHVGYDIPKFVKYLRTFGKAGIVKNMKDGKVGNRGITMMFVGYLSAHTGSCYRMYNPVTLQVSETRDIFWLGRMYFTSENCKKTKMLPAIAVPITNDVSNKDMSVTEVIKITLPNTMGWEGKVTDTETHETPNSSNKEGWEIVTIKRGQKGVLTGRYNPSSGKTVTWNVTATEVDQDNEKVSQARHYDIFNVVDQDEITLTLVDHNMYFKVANVGAGVGGWIH